MSIHPIVKIFLIGLFGFLLSLSAPGYDLWFFAWIFLSPLFIIINTSRTIKETILYSVLFGFCYNVWYLHWLFSLHPLTWLGFSNSQSIVLSLAALFVVSVYNSLFFGIFAVAITYLKKVSVSPYNKGITNLLLTTFIWLIIFNKIQASEQLLGFPWTLIEYSQYKNLFLIQIAEYFGSISISFLIVLSNLVLANIFIWLFNIQKIGDRYIPRDPAQFETIVLGFSFTIILISLSIIFGVLSYKKNQEHFSNESQSICILQGNLPIKSTRGGSLNINLARKTYNTLIQNNESALLIAPEGALPTIYNSDPATQWWLKNTAKEKQADLISGSYCKNKETLTNCAVAYSPSINQFSSYEKERLVPFGEFTPLSFLLPKSLKKIASNIIGEGFSKGKQNAPLKTSFGLAGVNICFELIFPAIIRKHSLQGANFFINLSDLSWFSNDLIKQQFISFGVFRAIENRKPLIIATNNGISTFIEPSGKIKSQSLSNSPGVLMDWINPNNKITFYARYGW